MSSLLFPSHAVPICNQRLASKLIGRNHESGTSLGLRHIDDSQIAAGGAAADGNARTLAPGSVLSWLLKNPLDFVLTDAVLQDVWLPAFRVNVEPDLHIADSTTSVRNQSKRGLNRHANASAQRSAWVAQPQSASHPR